MFTPTPPETDLTPAPGKALDVVDLEFEALLSYLKRGRGCDLTGYKRSSLMRRFQIRMQKLQVDSFHGYLQYMQQQPDEYVALLNDVLINVTSFFRDADDWDYLAAAVIPKILASKSPDEPIRLWSAGCATGQEVYSLLILVAEAIGLEACLQRVQCFATDANETALGQARQATYQEHELLGLPNAWLEKYFQRTAAGYVFHPELHRTVVFARHDLTQNAPISGIDLLICRNVLIYFNPETQVSILTGFHFALKNTGFLFLGRAEILTTHRQIFTPESLHHRVYTRGLELEVDEYFLISPRLRRQQVDNVIPMQNHFWETVFETSPFAQLAIDTNGCLLHANEQARSLFGLTVADWKHPFAELELAKLIHPDALKAALHPERSAIVLKAVPWETENGITYFDINIAHVATRRSHLLGVMITLIEVNAQMLKSDRRFLAGQSLSVYLPPSDRPAFAARLLQLWMQPQEIAPPSWEIVLVPRNSPPIEVSVTVALNRNNAETVTHLRWMLLDISNRKRTEAQLRSLNAELERRIKFAAALNRITDKVRESLEEEQILQAAVRELTFAFGILGCDVALYDLNQRVSIIRYTYSTTNQPLSAPAGTSISMPQFPQAYQQLLQRQHFQFSEIAADSQRRELSILSCPIYDVQGVLGDFWLFHRTGFAFDEAEIALVQQVAYQCAIALRQSHLYQTAQAQVVELARLNRLKDDFLSTVSHELRTPITNIKMALQMLQLAKTPEQQERYLAILQKECDREANLINDFLDMQRLEESRYPNYLSEAIDLPEWLPIILKPIQSRAEARKQRLTVDLPNHCPPFLSDRSSLRRILVELLTNACKYTPTGGEIILQILLEPTLSEGTTTDANAFDTIFKIHNQAEIPAREFAYIFEKFYRIPAGDPWQQGGTGLGLALVQELVKQLQGTIQVASKDGWTTFSVRLSKLKATPPSPLNNSSLSF